MRKLLVILLPLVSALAPESCPSTGSPTWREKLFYYVRDLDKQQKQKPGYAARINANDPCLPAMERLICESGNFQRKCKVTLYSHAFYRGPLKANTHKPSAYRPQGQLCSLEFNVKPEFHSIYILWTTIVNECARWDFVSPLEVDYSDFEGVDEPESLSDCFNFYFYHDSGAKMTIAECQNIVNLKLFPTQKTTTTTTRSTTSKATTRTEAKTTTHVTTTSTTQKSTTSSTKMKSTTTKSSKFTKLLITTKKPTTVSEVKIDVIRPENLSIQLSEAHPTKPSTTKKITTTSMMSEWTTKRVSRKKSSSSIDSISSPTPVDKTFDGIVDFDFGNLVILSPVIPKVETPDQNSVVIKLIQRTDPPTQPSKKNCRLKCGHGGKCVKKGKLEFCECPEERSHALAPPIGKCVKNLKKFCKRGVHSTETVEGVGKQNTCQCDENMRFNPATFTCEEEVAVRAKCSESCSARDPVRTYAPCCRQLDIWIRRHKWKGRTLSLWGAWSSCDQKSCTKTRSRACLLPEGRCNRPLTRTASCRRGNCKL